MSIVVLFFATRKEVINIFLSHVFPLLLFMFAMFLVKYQRDNTGSPNTSRFGVIPKPGSVDASILPSCLFGDPSAMQTPT